MIHPALIEFGDFLKKYLATNEGAKYLNEKIKNLKQTRVVSDDNHEIFEAVIWAYMKVNNLSEIPPSQELKNSKITIVKSAGAFLENLEIMTAYDNIMAQYKNIYDTILAQQETLRNQGLKIENFAGHYQGMMYDLTKKFKNLRDPEVMNLILKKMDNLNKKYSEISIAPSHDEKAFLTKYINNLKRQQAEKHLDKEGKPIEASPKTKIKPPQK